MLNHKCKPRPAAIGEQTDDLEFPSMAMIDRNAVLEEIGTESGDDSRNVISFDLETDPSYSNLVIQNMYGDEDAQPCSSLDIDMTPIQNADFSPPIHAPPSNNDNDDQVSDIDEAANIVEYSTPETPV